MIVLQLIVWIVFGAVSFLGIAYLFHAFGKVEDSKTVSVKYASWAIQLFIVVCYLHSVYHFGKWLDAVFFQGASPTRHWEGACARGGAAPLSPEGFLLPLLRCNHNIQRDSNTFPTRKINLPNQKDRKAQFLGVGTEKVQAHPLCSILF